MLGCIMSAKSGKNKSSSFSNNLKIYYNWQCLSVHFWQKPNPLIAATCVGIVVQSVAHLSAGIWKWINSEESWSERGWQSYVWRIELVLLLSVFLILHLLLLLCGLDFLSLVPFMLLLRLQGFFSMKVFTFKVVVTICIWPVRELHMDVYKQNPIWLPLRLHFMLLELDVLGQSNLDNQTRPDPMHR